MYLENKKLHFIGIGGIGMSGLAKIMLGLGNVVTGSDPGKSYITDELESLGAKIFFKHESDNINGADIIIYSTAIKKNNPELEKAIKLNLPILRRAELLAILMKLKKSVAIAGSHGKTTTSSVFATILEGCHQKPSYIIGGIVNNFKSHAKLNEGEYLVVEADESDGTFHLLNPYSNIITNIDNDHLDFYKNLKNVKAAFIKFINMIPEDGINILNIEDSEINKILPEVTKPYLTIGLNQNADYYAKDIKLEKGHICFSLVHKSITFKDFKIYGFGFHNLLNTLGAIAMSHFIGLDFEEIKKSLLDFKGAKRRLDKLQETDKTIIYDDYAHHTTEIYHTLKSLKSSYQEYHIECVFQPHRYSRTKDSWDQMHNAFEFADKVYVLDVYSAGEEVIEGYSAFDIVEKIGKKAIYLSDKNLCDIIKDEDTKRIIACLGAGSISKWIRDLCLKN